MLKRRWLRFFLCIEGLASHVMEDFLCLEGSEASFLTWMVFGSGRGFAGSCIGSWMCHVLSLLLICLSSSLLTPLKSPRSCMSLIAAIASLGIMLSAPGVRPLCQAAGSRSIGERRAGPTRQRGIEFHHGDVVQLLVVVFPPRLYCIGFWENIECNITYPVSIHYTNMMTQTDSIHYCAG